MYIKKLMTVITEFIIKKNTNKFYNIYNIICINFNLDFNLNFIFLYFFK